MLNLTGKIDTDTVKILEVVSKVTSELDVPYLLVGATARDLVMHYGYDAPIQRATTDRDFGIQVESWEAFKNLKKKLTENNFRETDSPQRMINSSGIKVDFVPFGTIENENFEIQWPPDGDVVMNVLGFEEAHKYAMQVIIQQEPNIQVPVATPQGLALLKLIAWDDRDKNKRPKDAKDLAYLMGEYQIVHSIINRAYEMEGLMDLYNWEINQATAHILGFDASEIAFQRTRSQIRSILNINFEPGNRNYLAEEMCVRIEDHYDNKLKLLEAFSNGFGK